MVFPEYRPRRMRRNQALRSLIRETTLSADQLIYPLFIVPGKKVKKEVPSMPGVHQISVDQLNSEARELEELGVNSVMLFGIPEKKDGVGSGAHDKDGIVQRAIRELKNKSSELLVITDVCLCEYTDHGHCGVLTPDGRVDNDATLDLYAQAAVPEYQVRFTWGAGDVAIWDNRSTQHKPINDYFPAHRCLQRIGGWRRLDPRRTLCDRYGSSQEQCHSFI